MNGQLEQVLMDLGPCLSSTAAAELCRRHGLKEEAARKRISRAEYPVQHLELPFRRNATFVFLASQSPTQEFFRALADALEANNGAYARALQAIKRPGSNRTRVTRGSKNRRS